MVVSGDEEILSEAKSDAYLPSIEKASRRFHSWMIGYLRIANQVRKRRRRTLNNTICVYYLNTYEDKERFGN